MRRTTEESNSENLENYIFRNRFLCRPPHFSLWSRRTISIIFYGDKNWRSLLSFELLPSRIGLGSSEIQGEMNPRYPVPPYPYSQFRFKIWDPTSFGDSCGCKKAHKASIKGIACIPSSKVSDAMLISEHRSTVFPGVSAPKTVFWKDLKNNWKYRKECIQ